MSLTSVTALLDGEPLSYTVRQSTRARRLSLTIRPHAGLIVTLPQRLSPDIIPSFLSRHRVWVKRHLAEAQNLAESVPKRWPFGPTLPFFGEEHPVVVEVSPTPVVERTEDRKLSVRLPIPSIIRAKRHLRAWYLAQAKQYLPERVRVLGNAWGLSWGRISVRDQRRRWGSCSPRGDLNFNYRLVMAPAWICDYVVAHELLHRMQLNHSRKFWALVADRFPRYKEAIAWLKRYGPFLEF